MSTIKIKAPAMPEPVATVSKGPVAFFCKFTESGKELRGEFKLHTAEQLAARDAQWQEMYEPVVEALEMAIREYAQLPHSLGYEFTHIKKMRAALAAITEK